MGYSLDRNVAAAARAVRAVALGENCDPRSMSASEQMFFLGAPLAHVVQYEEFLRAGRIERIRAMRRQRLPNPPGALAARIAQATIPSSGEQLPKP